MQRIRILGVTALALVFAVVRGGEAQTTQPSCVPPNSPGGPSSILPVSLSGTMPTAVPLPTPVNNAIQIRPFFDWFSWEEFIALNWPASTKGRGIPANPGNPAALKKAAPGSPTVWTTYKANWELFDQGSARPTAFDVWNAQMPNSCAPATAGQTVLLMSSKGNSILSEGVQAFSFPLVDAASNYVMYDVRYDRAAYDFMRGTDGNPSSWLYLSKNLSPPVQRSMPPSMTPKSGPPSLGAVMIKAAWRDMTPVPKSQWSRYFVVSAQVFDPASQRCQVRNVGLVGLHIAQKTSLFTEWVWSTFEQIDVLPGLLPPCAAGDTACSQQHGWANRPTSTLLLPQPSQRTPVHAARLNPIATSPSGLSTADVNAAFQKALAGTVWAYYQLVVTQWPQTPPTYKAQQQRGEYPCGAGNPFPQTGAVNLTMETYFQSASDAMSQGNSCLQCHYGAALTDFSWGLARRPHP